MAQPSIAVIICDRWVERSDGILARLTNAVTGAARPEVVMG